VSSKLESLLARVKSITSLKRGKQTELAAFLKVGKNRVSEWLSLRHEPGAEITLQILQWVEDEEDQQKQSPSRASTRLRPKTQQRKSMYEKAKSGRKNR
jgi:transcriptional regulator with XRE-family HTH domain